MKATLIGLVTLAATAAAVPSKRQSDMTIVCETSDASPTTEDVTELINNLKGAEATDTYCVNGSFGVDCSPTWTDHNNGNSAAFQACGSNGGGRFRCGQGTTIGTCGFAGCPGLRPFEVAGLLEKIQAECESDGKVGGFADYDDGDLKLIHS